jgi:hypothetical protein
MKKLLMKGMVLAAGLLLSSAPAHAQVVQFTVNPIDSVGGVPNPPASGLYQVTLTPNGASSWDWVVKGLNDGDADKSDAVSITVSITKKPSAGGGQMIVLGSSFAGTTAGGPYAATPWTTFGGANLASFTAPDAPPPSPGPNWLNAKGVNSLVGKIDLAEASSNIDTINVTIRGFNKGNDTQVWGRSIRPEDATLTPEPASMTLAMAGLAPAGLALLKRRRRSSVEETEETEEA